MNQKMQNNLLKNRRAQEALYEGILQLLFVLIFLGMFLFYLNNVAAQSLLDMSLSKEVALLIDNSRPGTSIQIENPNIAITEKKIVAVQKQSYDFFTNLKILSPRDSSNKILTINIEK